MSNPKPTVEEVKRLKEALYKGLSMRIPTFEILRRYEAHYDRAMPYLTHEENFNIQQQFARHENFLSEQTGLPLRPSQQEIRKQAAEAVNIAHSRPRQAREEEKPSGSGDIRRTRSASEAELMSREQINWDEF